MKNNLLIPLRGRASRLFFKIALTLFFYSMRPTSAMAAVEELDASMSGYAARMAIALVILGIAGYLAAKWAPGRFRASAGGKLKLLGTLNLGRDMVYIIRTGPDVVAILAGRTGGTVIGRWSGEEWDECGDDLENGARSKDTPHGGR
ncbi:MAG: hypothetical protein LBQ56_04650 [Synergistaceae bacterium]|jgi:hypothetical protein|nr:hypothetical protein [Synergistaceae bacterium]